MPDLESEFYTALARTPDVPFRAFENNWPYILQATRNGLAVHRYNGSIVYATRKFPYAAYSPIVIVHSLGHARREHVLEIAKKEHAQGKQVIMKNVPVHECHWWHAHGFRVSTRPWDEFSLFDDNTFPQYISRAQTIRESDYSKKYRKVLRRFESRHAITTSLYRHSSDKAVIALLNTYARYLTSKNVGVQKEIIRALDFFFDPSIKNKIRFQFTENGKVIGSTFFTIVNNVAYSNAIISRVESDITKCVIHRSMHWISQKFPQVEYFCRQGSETAGQDWMKSRLNPFEANHRVHLEYVGDTTA